MLKKTLTGAAVIAAACGLLGAGSGVAVAAATPATPASVTTHVTRSAPASISPKQLAQMLFDQLNRVPLPADAPGAAQLAQAKAEALKLIGMLPAVPGVPANQSPQQTAQMLLDQLNAIPVPADAPGAAQLAQAKAELKTLIAMLPPVPGLPETAHLSLPTFLCQPLDGATSGLYAVLHGIGLPNGAQFGLPNFPRFC